MAIQKINLPIKGMSCPSCSARVERLVDELEGIKFRNVSHEKNSGEFTFDDQFLTKERLIAKINEGNYPVDLPAKPVFSYIKPNPSCPTCSEAGQKVPNTVLKSNIKIESKDKIDLDLAYYICKNAACSTAYYSTKNVYIIGKDELKRELWYKNGTERVIACYCNNIDTLQLKDAIENHNLSSWKEITAHYRSTIITKCEVLNPTGYCCTRFFNEMVQQIKKEII